MDRLFDHAAHPEDQVRTKLAALDLDLERHRRLRRILIGVASLASLLCWAHTRFAIAPLVFAPPLFAFFALSGASVWLWERRIGRRRRRVIVQLATLVRRTIGAVE